MDTKLPNAPHIVLSSTVLSLSLASSFFSFLGKGTQRLEKKNYSHFLFELVRVRLCALTSEVCLRKGKIIFRKFSVEEKNKIVGNFRGNFGGNLNKIIVCVSLDGG